MLFKALFKLLLQVLYLCHFLFEQLFKLLILFLPHFLTGEYQEGIGVLPFLDPLNKLLSYILNLLLYFLILIVLEARLSQVE